MKQFSTPRLISLLVVFIIVCFSNTLKSQIFFEDDCNANFGAGYTEEYVKFSIPWDTLNGGHSTDMGIPGSGSPPYAYEGDLNYVFWQGSPTASTKLILPPLDLQFAIKPQLRFRHAMADWGGDVDQLRIYFKKHLDAEWIELEEYTLAQENWILREIYLPDTVLFSDSCLIAFEATNLSGHGACVDSIRVVETEIAPLSLDSIYVTQTNEVYTPSGSNNNSVLMINLSVSGNDGVLPLNSITVTSSNSNDSDIKPSGVKLFVTNEPNFYGATQLSTGVSFSGGTATFSGINYMLNTGYNYLWVTYDISSSAIHLNNYDGYIDTDDITVDGVAVTPVNGDPNGAGIIYESVFFDDFEADNGWTLNGEWERDIPQGLGNNLGFNADPDFAYSGTYALGTDLTGLGTYPGNYEFAIVSDSTWYAVSPLIDCKFYRDVNISCYRYLNIENQDKSGVDISIDDGNTWQSVWTSELLRDNIWKLFELSVTDIAERQQQVRVRFSLGPTDSVRHLSGWNLDNFALTGNLIEKDIAIVTLVEPATKCGFGGTEQVTVEVRNLAANPAVPPIPICFSVDGVNVEYDTITSTIPVDGTLLYTFSQTIDLSEPKIYDKAFAAINYSGDEDTRNDTFKTVIYALPSLEVPNANNFDNDRSFWQPGGTNCSWEYGVPSGSSINRAATGAYAWVTNLNGRYGDDEDSYIESPCYDLTTVDRPILKFKYISETQTSVDGLQIQYSIDDGGAWYAIDKHPLHSFDWDWYENPVSSLGGNGVSGLSGGWESAQVVLPDAVLMQPSVKFRIAFASNADINYFEGVGIDDLEIIESPIDIGVESIDNISDLCQYENPENVQVTVRNYGIKQMYLGDTIVLGLKLNDEVTLVDSFQLTADMAPLVGTEQFIFNQKIQLDEAGSQTIRSFTLVESDPTYYGAVSNDTASITVTISQSPITNMADTIATMMVDTVVLSPQYNASYSYLWNDADTNRLKDTIYYGTYTLTVTDEISKGGNGCTTPDTVRVQVLFSDVGSAGILSPVSSCELTGATLITVGIRNEGNDTLRIGQKIPVALSMDGMPFTYDTVTLDSEVWPKKVYKYEFANDLMNMSAVKSYNFTMFTIFPGDTIHTTDTANTRVDVWGYPTVDIGPDNIYHKGTFYIYTVLSGASNYKTILWSDSTNTNTYFANSTGYHRIDVTDFNNCPASDSSYLQLLIRDIQPLSFIEPVAACGAPNNTDVTISLRNSGTDTLKVGDTYPISYHLTDDLGYFESTVNDQIDITTEVYPGSVFMYTFTDQEAINDFGNYNFDISLNSVLDMVVDNDSLSASVEFYQVPIVDFYEDETGVDRVNAYSKELIVMLDSNFYPEWQDGSHENIYTVDYPDFGNYWCTVTDTTTGCFDRDTVQIQFALSDFGVESVLSPPSVCASEFNSVFIRIRNYGNIAYIAANNNLFVVYSYSGSKQYFDTVDVAISGNNVASFEVKNIEIATNGDADFQFYTQHINDIKADNDTINTTIEINDSPYLDWSAADTLTCPATLDATQSESGASYFWQDGSIGKSYRVQNNGVYSVNISFPNGCEDDFETYIHCGVGIEEINNNAEILVYPNPASDQLSIKYMNLESASLNVELIDINGRVMWNGKKEKNDFETCINVKSYPEGLYFLRLYNKDIIEVSKVLIVD